MTNPQLQLLAVVSSLVVLFPLEASAQQEEPRAEIEGKSPEIGAAMTVLPVSDALDVQFRPLYAERPFGPRLFVLEGDPKIGPSITLFRYGRNYAGSGNLHFHTHDYRLFLIEGNLKHWGADSNQETAATLQPGSFVHQPAMEPHAANCLSKQCTAYVIFDGPIETGFP